MKAGRIIIHIIITLAVTVSAVGVPLAHILDRGDTGDADAVSGATIKLSEKPSGEYIILVNRTLHEDSIGDWTSFFRDGELNVIFDDISCLAAKSDIQAIKLVQSMSAQLPENQMKLRTEDMTLLASKAENGCIDAAVFSKEFADAIKLKTDANKDIICIKVKGGEPENEKDQ